jgi:6-O-methylguanine DNA methyltransferase, DNA binding domain
MHDILTFSVHAIKSHNKRTTANSQSQYPLPTTALKHLHPETDVPWQRVVSATGQISSRGPQTEGADRQREVLETEGVQVQNLKVSWKECGWFPDSVSLDMDE